MRLGKEQASGYVADTVTDSIAADEGTFDSAERSRPTPAPEPAVIPEPAHSAG
jgi:hypothetical protein